MRLKYNSPVILTFTLLSTVVYLCITYIETLNAFFLNPESDFTLNQYFLVPGTLDDAGFPQYLSIITHILGHSSWEHLLSNFSLILLIGPILEEKYGSGKIFLMIIITALLTGLLNILFLDSALLGASGIVFMLILLSSITNYRNGDIPITFVLVVILYLGKELWGAFEEDKISQFGHIIGGIVGAIFGFVINRQAIEKIQMLETEEVIIEKPKKSIQSLEEKTPYAPYENEPDIKQLNSSKDDQEL